MDAVNLHVGGESLGFIYLAQCANLNYFYPGALKRGWCHEGNRDIVLECQRN